MSIGNSPFRHASIADICNLTGSSFDAVHALSKRLGLRAPFTLFAADQLCRKLRGYSALDLFNAALPQQTANYSCTSEFFVCVPWLPTRDGVYTLTAWLVEHQCSVREGQALAKISANGMDSVVVKANNSGILRYIRQLGAEVQSGDYIGVVSTEKSLSLPRTGDLPKDSGTAFRVLAPFRFDGVWRLDQWLTSSGSFVRQGSELALIKGPHPCVPFTIKAGNDGILKYVVSVPSDVKSGELIAVIEASTPVIEKVHSVDIALSSSSLKNTTSQAVKNGVLQPEAGIVPFFQPSSAAEPMGFSPKNSAEEDLSHALSNPSSSFQSFFSDLQVISPGLINDDIVSLPCFDESLYCSLVREMHRFSLAEIADNRTDLAQKNAGLGAMVGGLLGLMSGNIFAPFLGHSYAKNLHDRGKRVEEFLPDPNLLFYQDENSYLSWSKAQVTSPRLRRLIIDRRVKGNGNIFFRLLPAFVTADSVFPLQLFKIDSQSYFYRPLSAGISRQQPNYDSIKIQRRYFHLRGEGVVNEAGFEVPVSGRDIEDYQCRVYRFRGSSLDYFYLDFKIHPGSVF